jgi:hypothetical protein
MRTILASVLGRLPRPTPAMAVALLALIVAASGAAVAAIPSADGTITACRDNKTGALRVINAEPPQTQTCTSKETQLTWINGLTGSQVADSAHADQADTATSAEDANTLDGKSADDLSRVAVMNTNGATIDIPATPTKVTYGPPLSITAPAAGFVRVNGNVTVLNNDCTALCTFDAWVYHVNTDTYSTISEESLEALGQTPGFHVANAGLDAVFPVSAGVNTFEIRLSQEGGTAGRLAGEFGVLTAEYTPYGSTGTGPQSGSAEQ